MEVGLLAVAASEDLVEDPERPDDLAPHEQAKADDRRRVWVPRGTRPRDAAREGKDVGTGRKVHGKVHGAVRERAAEADRWILLAARHHAFEGSLREERVGVEETDPRRVGEEKPAVCGLHETEIHLVFEEDDSFLRPQEFRRPGVAPVVDDDDAGPDRGEAAHALEAVACRAQRVVDRDDEVAAHAGGRNRHGFVIASSSFQELLELPPRREEAPREGAVHGVDGRVQAGGLGLKADVLDGERLLARRGLSVWRATWPQDARSSASRTAAEAELRASWGHVARQTEESA